MANIDLTTNGWVDLIFEGRNHEYGAYKLRKGTPKRNIYSIIVIAILAALLVGIYVAKSAYDKYQANVLWDIVERYTLQIEQSVLKECFIYEKPVVDIAKSRNLSVAQIRTIKKRGLLRLSRGQARRKLLNKLDLLDCGIYRNGVDSFKAHGTSKVEHIAIRRIELTDAYIHMVQQSLKYVPRQKVCL